MDVRTATRLVRDLGPRWILFRLRYAIEQRAGLQARRTPALPWAARPLAAWLRSGVPASPDAYMQWRQSRPQPPAFFFDTLPTPPPRRHVIDEADALLAGRWRYFEKTIHDIGFPPRWHVDPETGASAFPADHHWSRVADSGSHDIKVVWEPSRFASVYTLVRAYARTRDERYAEGFWQLVEDWAAHNPPMLGANWRCGQETSFRVMAWCLGLHAFRTSPATTPARVAAIVAMLAWSAERVEANIAYARSQKNNHAISEGLGLWTVGVLFPELARAAAWRANGQRVLEEEAARQIYDDGSFVQHSTNYHRLMLQDYLWVMRLAEVNRVALAPAIADRVERAVQWLYAMVDETSGGAPNLGWNDGALIMPLTDDDFTDYRAVLQAHHFQRHRERLYPEGPWDEALLWMFGDAARPSPEVRRHRAPMVAADGGYVTMIGEESWAMLRCATYRDRPAHADQLHLDLWWRGTNVAIDAGTYRYTDAGPWPTALASTRTHNTVTVDGQDQMLRAGRFLWLDWSRGTMARVGEATEGIEAFEGRHDGYARRGVTHRRAVLRAGDAWIVVDDLWSRGQAGAAGAAGVAGTAGTAGAGDAHDYRLHWLLADAPHTWAPDTGTLTLHLGGSGEAAPLSGGDFVVRTAVVSSSDAPAPATVCRGGACGVETDGWSSRYYRVKEPALSLSVETRVPGHVRFVSVLTPGPAAFAAFDAERIAGQFGGAQVSVQLVPLGAPIETERAFASASCDWRGHRYEWTGISA